MTVETALYPQQLNTEWPLASDMVSEGDNHIRLLKIVDKTTWPNVAGAVSASHIELSYVTGVTSGIQAQLDGKGSRTGQTWTGAHIFSGSAAVPTLAQGTSTTGAASTAFVQTEWSTRLPNYTEPITASTTELNRVVGVTSGIQGQLNARGAIAGQSWSGAHDYTAGTLRAATLAAGTNTTEVATTAFVASTAFSSALPLQTGNAGKFATTNGTNASWAFVGFASLTGKPTTVTGYGITDAVTTAGDQTIAGNKSFTGSVLATGAGGLGYGVGAGGTVTQATSKSTTVTLNKRCGQITTSTEALAAGASVQFQVNNSTASGPDGVTLTITGGTANASAYRVRGYVQGGAFFVRLANESAGSLSDAVVVNFQLHASATS